MLAPGGKLVGSKHVAISLLIVSLKAKTRHLLISAARDQSLNWLTIFFSAYNSGLASDAIGGESMLTKHFKTKLFLIFEYLSFKLCLASKGLSF